MDACEDEGGVPSRLIKTDRRKAEKEGTLWQMFARSLSGRTTRLASRSMSWLGRALRRMIAAALEAEVAEYVERSAGERDENGKRLVVRNGHARERR